MATVIQEKVEPNGSCIAYEKAWQHRRNARICVLNFFNACWEGACHPKLYLGHDHFRPENGVINWPNS